jgi:hypothetical protein
MGVLGLVSGLGFGGVDVAPVIVGLLFCMGIFFGTFVFMRTISGT